MKLFVTPQAKADIAYWNRHDRTKTRRIRALIENVLQTPFAGIGKPEPFKHDLQGYWSRRIDHEHRLVYAVDEDTVTVIRCRYHYK